jgi:hypothetical protein
MKRIIENWNKWLINESISLSQHVDSGMVHLYHYSRAEAPSILLDPERFKSGRNSWSMREYNVSPFPRVFFYVDSSKTEADIAHGIPYEVSVPASDIYDLTTDPEGVLKRSSTYSEYSKSVDIHKTLKALAGKDKPSVNFPHLFTPIRDEGAKIYKGVYYMIREETIPVVAWFEEIEAARATEEESEREEA